MESSAQEQQRDHISKPAMRHQQFIKCVAVLGRGPSGLVVSAEYGAREVHHCHVLER